ncbi:complex I intermediate-associated protein 30, mitochondrial [Athalia rosae]|uniref:complex I intermediate-associated protein 30, mitochondrial n=1 Tax=Athalia rosae TaxID=37344 RepID=UPI002033A12E|nr:complex I intermediate-associated protein 30, mitochondrial [Athalia rosae]
MVMYTKISRVISTILERQHVTAPLARQMSFWEKDRRGGYPSTSTEKRSEFWHIRNGLSLLGDELRLFKREVIERFENDPVLLYRENEIDVVWRFDGDEKSLSNWIVTADSDNGEGYSNCRLELTKSGRGLFSGHLDTRLPKTGDIKRAGYCNIKTVRARKSFKREANYDWNPYNHLVMRVRGDGRSYLLNISTAGYFDLMWHDVYHYVLYTRGGPYWQYVKIPFSKFFFASKGRVQDKQEPIPLDSIVNFGITAGDKVTGPFHLEIDYIGVIYDPNHKEEFAYEMYRTDKNIAAH